MTALVAVLILSALFWGLFVWALHRAVTPAPTREWESRHVTVIPGRWIYDQDREAS